MSNCWKSHAAARKNVDDRATRRPPLKVSRGIGLPWILFHHFFSFPWTQRSHSNTCLEDHCQGVGLDPAKTEKHSQNVRYYTIIDFNEVDKSIYLPEKVIFH